MKTTAKKKDPEPREGFAADLTARALETGKRKGERTRDRLKASAARLLETAGYRDLRVSDINEGAGVSNALFYVYFNNKEEITREILTEFLESLQLRTESFTRDHHPAARIYAGNLEYIRTFKANRGLMRCLIQFGDEFPEFRELWRNWNTSWNARVVAAMARDPELQLKTGEERALASAALGMMVDGLLRLTFIDGEYKLAEMIGSAGLEELALFLTRLWYRAIYARDLDWTPAKPDGLAI